MIDIEIVALAGWPLTGPDGADQQALLRDAIAAGADRVGGCPHLEGTGTAEPTAILLDIAADLGVGVDLHTDETLDPQVDGLSDLARAVLAGFDLPVEREPLRQPRPARREPTSAPSPNWWPRRGST